jgi:hypothetical protein
MIVDFVGYKIPVVLAVDSVEAVVKRDDTWQMPV